MTGWHRRPVDALIDDLARARRIGVAGAGRERLQVMGLAVRLHPLGLDAHGAGEMTCPPVGPGDLVPVGHGSACALVGNGPEEGSGDGLLGRTLPVIDLDQSCARGGPRPMRRRQARFATGAAR